MAVINNNKQNWDGSVYLADLEVTFLAFVLLFQCTVEPVCAPPPLQPAVFIIRQRAPDSSCVNKRSISRKCAQSHTDAQA